MVLGAAEGSGIEVGRGRRRRRLNESTTAPIKGTTNATIGSSAYAPIGLRFEFKFVERANFYGVIL